MDQSPPCAAPISRAATIMSPMLHGVPRTLAFSHPSPRCSRRQAGSDSKPPAVRTTDSARITFRPRVGLTLVHQPVLQPEAVEPPQGLLALGDEHLGQLRVVAAFGDLRQVGRALLGTVGRDHGPLVPVVGLDEVLEVLQPVVGDAGGSGGAEAVAPAMSCSPFSSSITDRPRTAAAWAAVNPALPPPTTTTSAVSAVGTSGHGPASRAPDDVVMERGS